MKPGIPWSVKGIEPEVREAAKEAARRSGMTLGDWLNSVILDQSDASEAQGGSDDEPREGEERVQEHAARGSARPETVTTLEAIAQQLTELARRDQHTAYSPHFPSYRQRRDDTAVERILDRVESNERQTVEAFTAVNDRLSVLGRQIALTGKAKAIDKPEDVPGYPALETAIRNVVDHIEVSEKCTRDSLKSMQERLATMATRAGGAGSTDIAQSAPAFAGLETRINEISNRLQRAEAQGQGRLPDQLRQELAALADRIEQVHAASEDLAARAQISAAAAAQRELRDIEARILQVLKNAQSTLGGPGASDGEMQRLRGEIASLNQRIDDSRAGLASERDVRALRVAVEQLSTRVAQGSDMRPLAEMDRRLADITARVERTQEATRDLPQVTELERRIAKLDHRLAEAMRLHGDGQALGEMAEHLADVSERLGRAEQQLSNVGSMERAIAQLYDGLEQTRNMAQHAVEEAANRAAERAIAMHAQQSGTSPELRALEDGLRAVRESALASDERNQETLEAVNETLEQIVGKLAELETASAGHQLAANLAMGAASPAAPEAKVEFQAPPSEPVIDEPAPHPEKLVFFDPTGAFDEPIFDPPPPPAAVRSTPEQATHPAMPQQMVDFTADMPKAVANEDFIAAARRAALAASTKPATASETVKPPPAARSRRFSFPLSIGRGRKKEAAEAPAGQAPRSLPPIKPAPGSESRRRTLILAGIVLLLAASAFTYNAYFKPAKRPLETSSITLDAGDMQIGPRVTKQAPANGDKAMALDMPVDGQGLVTGSLPPRKTDASITAIVAEPGSTSERAEMPPPETGTESLRIAAANGDAKAQFVIASRYLDGQGIAQDFTKAAYWYQLAASSGLAPAQYRLATLFERGRGVPLDIATALLWYERAAEAGNIKSMHNAAVIYAGNQAGTPDYDKAFRLFTAAATRGLKDSQFNLAVLHERGLGTKIDSDEAYFWYLIAAREGDNDARKRAEEVGKVLGLARSAKVSVRVDAWKPQATEEAANVVAVNEASWRGSLAKNQDTAPEETSAEASANPITLVQQLLTKLGFNIGEPDGKMGLRTANAIRLFQLQSGMPVTGEITPELIDHMKRAAS
ncbi:MAG: hypothetical protein FJX63_00475 [Alphaproteobacteria bacterium]|nr:hypothetical protein [Alphaproteobacteria bacterium]